MALLALRLSTRFARGGLHRTPSTSLLPCQCSPANLPTHALICFDYCCITLQTRTHTRAAQLIFDQSSPLVDFYFIFNVLSFTQLQGKAQSGVHDQWTCDVATHIWAWCSPRPHLCTVFPLPYAIRGLVVVWLMGHACHSITSRWRWHEKMSRGCPLPLP